ncbi:hypothetical protein HCN44_000327 [Aphidius gifuensis]|uniref:Uncharacterized protein n=1 Tax=Aphidius gifuensis TaxID=684658 RepID=A0A834XPY1_APHGI|nr:hypothetical protein HCN44_000327 [Aphidius gifuensis]
MLFHICKNEKKLISNTKKAIATDKPLATENDVDLSISRAKDFLDSSPCDDLQWKKIKRAWKKTSQLRKIDLKKIVERAKKRSKKIKEQLVPTEEFLKNWPILSCANGHKLIDIDFKLFFPEANIITEEKLNELIYKLDVLNSKKKSKYKKKWETEINVLKQLFNNTNVDTKISAYIRILPFLLPPHGRANMKNKTTVVDVEESIILFARNNDEMKVIIQKRSQKLKKLGKPFQPVIVIIGKDWEEINDILCFITEKKFIYNIESKVHPEAVAVMINLSVIADKVEEADDNII